MRTLLLCGLIGLAQAFQNDSSDAIFIRGLPSTLLRPPVQWKSQPHVMIVFTAFWAPKIFPQYITLAFRSPQNGPSNHQSRGLRGHPLPMSTDSNGIQCALTAERSLPSARIGCERCFD